MMDLQHLVNLIAELPTNTEMSYVRSNDKCTFLRIDTSEPRVFARTNTNEEKSWAPSFLEEFAPKILENVPFSTSSLLNNKGSFRPVIDTIIAHTREFYWVKKGTAIETVWIPSMPKASLDLEEIQLSDIPAPKQTIDTRLLSKEDLVPKVRESFIKFWNLIDQHGADYDYYVKCFEETLNPYIEKLGLGIDNVFQIVNYADYVSIIKRITEENPEAAFLVNGRKNGGDRYVAASTHLHYKNYLEILSVSDFIRIPVEPTRLKNADDVIQESSFRQFARSVMQHFYKKDEFYAFFDGLRVFRKSGDTFKWVADGTNLMFKANNATEEAGYFMDEYLVDGVTWYLSSSPRTERFPLFANFINQHYPEYYAEKRNGNYYLCKLTDDRVSTKPLQLIYYGAPGTGKSHTIAKETNPRNSVRTTFHPDSDYASFVGAYKPTMDEVEIPALVGTNVQNAVGVNGHSGKQKKIVYKYVPQAFLKAYVADRKSVV